MIIYLDRLFVASRWNKFLTKPSRLVIFFIDSIRNAGALKLYYFKKTPVSIPKADFMKILAVISILLDKCASLPTPKKLWVFLFKRLMTEQVLLFPVIQ